MNSKKLIEMARKWRKVAALSKRISSAKNDAQLNSDACSTSIAERGHFIIYTSDGKRFMVPLSFLETTIFVELLKMSEDDLGLPSNGPIVLPSDSVFMEYVLSSLRKRWSKDMDRLLLDSAIKHQHSPCSSRFVGFSQRALCSF